MNDRAKWLLASAGIAVVVYACVVLGFVVTSPDLRLRTLIVDRESGADTSQGVRIQATPGIAVRGGGMPRPGDLLRHIGRRPVRTFVDVTQQMKWLRGAAVTPGWEGVEWSPPLSVTEPLVGGSDGHRYARVAYRPRGGIRNEVTYVRVQSLPQRDVLLLFIGFALELAILAVGALAYWHRPFDRSARLFFAMCIVALGAFAGGSHWWVIAGNLWLVVPFTICAMLVPVVSLHFFLAYPRPKPPLSRAPRATLAAVYVLPVAAVGVIVGFMWYTAVIHSPVDPARNVERILQTLGYLQKGVYAYFVVAAVYFSLLLVALATSYLTARSPLERSQLRWIGGGAMIASVLVGYSLYLALARRVDFAMGAAKVPMFLANMAFMLAYTVAIVRYKLLLVDQVVGRGMMYAAVSGGLCLAFGLAVGLSIHVPQLLNISLLSHQAWMVSAVLTLTAILFLWLRDRFQQVIDRQFFREKYRLDEALQRINRAVGHLGQPAALADLMFASCRDVLGVDRAALYLRGDVDGAFRLVAADGGDDLPSRIPPDPEWLEPLRQEGSAQRVPVASRRELSATQKLLHDLHGGLVHLFEANGVPTGVVILGEKRDKSPFTAEDMTFLNALTQMTHVALHSARLIEQNAARMNEEIRRKLEKIAEQKRQIAALQSELTRTQQPPGVAAADDGAFRRETIRGNSPAVLRVLEMVRKVASSESSVLIRGESGTGKELLAQILHDNSPRRDGPMVRVHCASLSPSLLESELFGHVKGAFTGAHQDKVGRFEAAHGGTLLLDEIGDISLETQIKLLRVLQERCFEPVGSARTVPADVRLVTATHQNLERLIAAGTFREDLYYRLNVISVTVPPLRERGEDVVELVLHFLNHSAQRMGKRITHIDDEALAALQRHRWPGNVRELQNVIERAVVLAEDDRITLRDLPAELVRASARPNRPRDVEPLAVAASAAGGVAADGHGAETPPSDGSSERDLLLQSLADCRGNKAEAARHLGMPRSTYFSKLKKHGLL